MQFQDVPLSTWFLYENDLYIKTDPFTSGDGTEYRATSLLTSWPGFATSDYVLLKVEVEVVEKPATVIPAAGSLRFDTKEKRQEVETEFRKMFPQVKMIVLKDEPGVFLLNYRTTLDIWRLIKKSKFGG